MQGADSPLVEGQIRGKWLQRLGTLFLSVKRADSGMNKFWMAMVLLVWAGCAHSNAALIVAAKGQASPYTTTDDIGVDAIPRPHLERRSGMPTAPPVQVAYGHQVPRVFRLLNPGEMRILLPQRKWKETGDAAGFAICGGEINGAGDCEAGGVFSKRTIPFVTPAEAVTGADPQAVLVEVEQQSRYLRLIFRIDPNATPSTVLPSGEGVSFGGAVSRKSASAEQMSTATSMPPAFVWLIGTLALTGVCVALAFPLSARY